MGPLFGTLLARRIMAKTRISPTEGPNDSTLVVPIPLHSKRLRERGYNQTLEISRSLAHALALPLRPDLLRRAVSTPHQIGLTRAQRQQNLVSAFAPRPSDDVSHLHAAHPDIAGASLLLVDDIMTTGSTLTAAALCLKAAGAATIHVAVAARTPEHP